MGRSGLEQGAQQLLRGMPGAVLAAVPPRGIAVPLLTGPWFPAPK